MRWMLMFALILLLVNIPNCLAESLYATGESFQLGLIVSEGGSVYVEDHKMPKLLLGGGKSMLYRLDDEGEELEKVLDVAYSSSQFSVFGDSIVYSNDPFWMKLIGLMANDRMWYMSSHNKDRLLYEYNSKENTKRRYFAIRGQLYYYQWPMDVDIQDEGHWEKLWKVTEQGDVCLGEFKNVRLIPYETIISIEGEYITRDKVIKLYDVVHEQIIEIPYDPLVFSDIELFYRYDIIMRDGVVYMAHYDWVMGYDIPSREFFVIREGTGNNKLYADGDYIYICDSHKCNLHQYSPAERKTIAELPYPEAVEHSYKAVINGKLVTWDTVKDIIGVTDLKSGATNLIEIR